jgi:hypothetical protein
VQRPFVLAAAALAFAVLLIALPGHAANDPDLVWHTIETPHFRVTYYSGEAEVAQHVADLGEAIFRRLSPAVGWSPTERTELLLTDQTDSANGSATALPYNAVRLFVTAPDDMSPLGDVDDWYQELVTHEYTHILHTDHISPWGGFRSPLRGIPAIVNALLGKTLAPNQVQPRWLLEGLAVFEESERTSGGRLRSSQWNMWMRADILEGNVAPLDVFSNTPRRWPQGNIYYLYGSFFLLWIAETYGEDAIRKMVDDYGGELIPYGINRSIRRATGRTFEELYPAFIDTLRREYSDQANAIVARGLREGTRITHAGQTALHPRWIPNNAWKDHAGDLLYFCDDGHTRSGLYAQPLERDAAGQVVDTHEKDRELVIRTSGVSSASFAPDGGVVFNSVDVTSNLFYFNDLFKLPTGIKSKNGMENTRSRWSTGYRAVDPDLSPDGRRVVFTTNHRGTTTLQIADVTPDGIANTHSLVPSGQFDQAFTPRWSPDNIHVAYSSWTKGGYRDIRLVDTRDGSFVQVTSDRAIDGGPSFSPDNKWLFYHSDRTRVMNIYAYEIATGVLKQVTNVVNGAYQPELSPDGKTLAYIGYTSKGFDVYAMPLDPSSWLEPIPYVEPRPSPPTQPLHRAWPTHGYNPLDTLVPRHYSVQITPGNFGQAIILTAAGSDIAGLHSIAATLTTEVEQPELQPDLQYSYGRLPVDLSLHLYRQITPGTGYQLGNNYKPTWVQEQVGVETGVSYSMPRAFDSQSFALSYSFSRVGGNLPTPVSKLDPYETPQVPTRGVVGLVHLGWSYSNAEQFLWSVGPEKGFSAGAGFDLTDPALASDFHGYDVTFNLAAYFSMPWLRHHALGLHASGGTSGGGWLGRGLFYVGGFVDLPIINVIRNSLVQGGVVLRGYPVVAEAGNNYALFNAEYRFPIVNIDRGPSTLPFFLNRVSGVLFVDYGSAFDDATTALFKTGTGGELWFDTTLSYTLGFTFRAGFAHGWASEGIDKFYFVAAVPF